MKPHFIWKDKSSLEYGLTITKLPPRIKPELRGEVIEIPGRNGTVFESEDVYNSKSIEIECTFTPPPNITDQELKKILMEIPVWLDGTDKLILSDYPDYYYEARISNTIPIERLFKRYRRFLLIFEIQPFSKSINESSFTLSSTNETNLVVSTHYPSSPILELSGTGNISIFIKNKVIHIKDLDGKIIIDCEFMNATINGVNANNKVNGFPLNLDPGLNHIRFELFDGATFQSLKIKYRGLWI